MKKTLLNLAVTMALSSAIFSGSVLSTQAYADETITDLDNNNNNTDESYMYPGMGVGAATGAVIAGPVGLVVGGVIGAFIGSSQQISDDVELTSDETTSLASKHTTENSIIAENDAEFIDDSSLTADNTELNGLQVAQLGPIDTVVDDAIDSQQDELLDILTTDLSLDVYFRSGSTNIESFYPARLVAIAKLMETMDQLELHLDGYSDRRGDKTKNIALANDRIENVREQLINAGVDENRIISKAFGEMKMVSSAGDLEAYTFDRKVVIRFERSGADSIHAMTTTLSASSSANPETEEPAVSASDEVTDPVVADASTRL